MLSVGFEPGNPSSQAATGIGMEQPTLPASSLSVLIPALNSSTYTVSFKPSTARILLFCQRLSGSPQAHFVCNNFFRVGLRTDSGSWPSLTGLRDRTHSIHHTRQISSGRVISPAQRPLLFKHTTLTRDKHPCLPRDSNPQSYQASGRRPTP